MDKILSQFHPPPIAKTISAGSILTVSFQLMPVFKLPESDVLQQ